MLKDTEGNFRTGWQFSEGLLHKWHITFNVVVWSILNIKILNIAALRNNYIKLNTTDPSHHSVLRPVSSGLVVVDEVSVLLGIWVGYRRGSGYTLLYVLMAFWLIGEYILHTCVRIPLTRPLLVWQQVAQQETHCKLILGPMWDTLQSCYAPPHSSLHLTVLVWQSALDFHTIFTLNTRMYFSALTADAFHPTLCLRHHLYEVFLFNCQINSHTLHAACMLFFMLLLYFCSLEQSTE